MDLLRSLPSGDTNLVLFQADMFNPEGFELAIQGCETVFHIAHPVLFGASKAQVNQSHELIPTWISHQSTV